MFFFQKYGSNTNSSIISTLFHYYSQAGGGGAELGGVEALQHGGGKGEGARVGDVVVRIDGVFAFL